MTLTLWQLGRTSAEIGDDLLVRVYLSGHCSFPAHQRDEDRGTGWERLCDNDLAGKLLDIWHRCVLREEPSTCEPLAVAGKLLADLLLPDVCDTCRAVGAQARPGSETHKQLAQGGAK